VDHGSAAGALLLVLRLRPRLIASRYGKISIVTPLTGAYPLVTLAFAALVLRERILLLQWTCIAAILVGMFFCTT
jgi:drug/metabolite transporter (DMT)-like permease